MGELTQGLEKDVIAALEEMIAALQKAQKDLENKQKQGQPQQQAGEDGEPPLVDTLSELKMIRALQMRVNTAHQALRRADQDRADRQAANCSTRSSGWPSANNGFTKSPATSW